MTNGGWTALAVTAMLAAGGLAAKGSGNRRSLALGDRVAYNPRWVARRPLGPGDKADALKARGTVVDASGALVNVRWDGSQDLHTYSYPNEIVLEQALAKATKAVQHRLPDTFDDLSLADRGGTLLTPDGTIPIKKIGKGMFATVYQNLSRPDRVLAFVSEGAYEKEILRDAHRSLPENPHIPAVEHFGTLVDGRSVYEMPFYTAPYRKGNAKPADHKAFNTIRKCVSSIYGKSKESRYELTGRKLACIEEAGIPASIFEALTELRDASANYGDTFDMEFSPRNVATDKDGNIVLLDLLFDSDVLRKRRQQAAR
jgi:hypothetical protein